MRTIGCIGVEGFAGLALAATMAVYGCAPKPPQGAAEQPAVAPTPAPTPAAASAPGASPPPAETLPPPVIVKDAGFAEPESILYDAQADQYLVSNINGKPFDSDDNGFISRVSPEGKLIELKWIDGAKPKVGLDAPKGMAISNGVLYVADIKWIRMFDAKTGASKGKLFANGATFLNDMSAAPNGLVYLTDTGWKEGAAGTDLTGSDQIFRISPKTVVPVVHLKDKALGQPNGLSATAEGVWVANAVGEVYLVSADGKKQPSTTLPKKLLDGLIVLPDGSLLVSSWEAKALYHGRPGGPFTELHSGLESPADIGYDTKRNRVLLPQMQLNQLAFLSLPQAVTAGAGTGAAPLGSAPGASTAPAASTAPGGSPAPVAGSPAPTGSPAPAGTPARTGSAPPPSAPPAASAQPGRPAPAAPAQGATTAPAPARAAAPTPAARPGAAAAPAGSAPVPAAR